MAVGDKKINLDGLKAVFGIREKEIGRIKSAMKVHPHSKNLLNRAACTPGGLSANGDDESTTGRCVSDYIRCKKGDTVYFSGISGTGTLIPVSGSGSNLILRLVTYTADRKKINKGSGNYPTWTNSYEIPDDDACWLRICFQTLATTVPGKAKVLTLTLNEAPASVADVDEYRDELLEPVDRAVGTDPEIVCWGDSFIANGGDETSLSKYLGDLTGLTPANRGVNSQGTGEVALRMGAVEVYVTLENNQIAEGDNVITAFRVSRGGATTLMQFGATKATGVPCTLAGVAGMFWNLQGANPKFTPDAAPSAPVPVAPMTRLLPDAPAHYPITVIWAGKNDMSSYSSDTGLAKKMADTVSAMAEAIPHKRFVILGVTASLSDGYATGGAARAVMDAYNAIMKRRYPENFIDIQAALTAPVADQTYMVRGLELAGIAFGTDTAHAKTDAEALAAGLLPASLLSVNGSEPDNIHPNAGCRQAAARIVWEHMRARGWI